MPETAKRLITAEDLYRFNLVSGAQISPDGQSVLYAMHRVDRKTEKKYANLWLASADGASSPRQFSFGDQSDTSPRWSPDGRYVAFLSNRADKDKPPQIYLAPLFGGEAGPLTHVQGEIQDFTWSPDGKFLACAVRKSDAEVLEREQDEQKKELGVVERFYDRVFYKLDGYGFLPRERWHIWKFEVATGEAQQLTDHAVYDETDPVWSPDGKTILFISNRVADPDAYPDRADLYTIPAEGGEFVKIETPVGSKFHPSFSPDGKWVAYYGQDGDEVTYKNTNLWTVPADGSAPACNLTGALDLEAGGGTINDMGGDDTMPPTWSPDSQTIFFQVAYHGSTILESISIHGDNLQTIIGEGGVVINFSLDQEQDHLAYTRGTLNDPAQIFLRDRKTGVEYRLTQVNRTLLDEIDLGTIEEVWYKGADGNDLQGWILKPPGFDPSQKYPSILEIHGGPLTQYGNFFMHEFYYLAAGGYVVYFTNPRGGRGYGEEHAGAIYANWGTKDYADLMAWADHVAGLPYIDRDRRGVTGGSYGGYMTVWIIGHTARFKAAVTQRCVSNFVSMWGSSDFNWAFQKELNNKPPFEALQFYWDRSPIAYIGNASTPTLVIHNEMDHRCPIEQGEQVFVALKRLGVDTAFVRFPAEFHGLSRNGRTDRRIARLGHIRGWFDQYLK